MNEDTITTTLKDFKKGRLTLAQATNILDPNVPTVYGDEYKKGEEDMLDYLVAPIGDCEPTELQVAERVYNRRFLMKNDVQQSEEQL